MTDSSAGGFGAWLRQKRTETGLSLRAFALETRLDPGNLSKYERGILPAPQDPELLSRLAKALGLKKGTRAYEEFGDLAAASAGRIPPDLAANPKALARMPLLFRTLRGRKLTKDQLLELAEKLKRL